MSMLVRIVIPIVTFSVSVWAVSPLSFKNFAPGKDGVWETTTTTAASSTPTVQKACVDVAQSKAIVEKMLSNPSPMAKCTFKIVSDSKDVAEVEQNCLIGQMKAKFSTKMKRLGEDSYETQFESDTMGRHTSAKMISRYKGPCTAADRAAQSSKMTVQCEKCKMQIEKLKTRCKTASGPEKQSCGAALRQIEPMCQMSCVPTHG
jgi:carbon monoxide dehydrogenase subunit G